ncbi:MAG: hypothetical protein GX933_01370 [Chloroflexi bacterium]|nr:hypothetical protein [Chloroflexota bacterium]
MPQITPTPAQNPAIVDSQRLAVIALLTVLVVVLVFIVVKIIIDLRSYRYR